MERQASVSATPDFPTSRNNLAIAAVCLASLMFGLEISSVPVTLPVLERVLNGNFQDAQWIMNAYTLAVTTVLMATGALADQLGRRKVFLASVLLFGVTSMLCGFAQNVPVLIIGRALQGASGGAMLICQVAVLSHQFKDGKARAQAFTAWGIIFGIGLGFGPTIGGLLLDALGWQWVFLIHVPIALLTLSLSWFGIQESRDPNAQKLDLAGMVTLSLAVFGLVFFITQGSDMGFTKPYAIMIAVATGLAFAGFVWAERASARPMFDFSVFRVPRFSGALMGSMGMNFSFWPFMIYIPIYFQIGLGYDTMTAGVALLAYTLPTLVSPPIGERLIVRHGPHVAIPAGLFTIGLGFFLMKFGSVVAQPSALTMMPGCVIAGLGLGLTNTPVTNTTTAAVSSDRAGMASGIDMTARMLSLAVNIALMGAILMAGVLAGLRTHLPETVDAASLQHLAQKIVAGDVDAARSGIPALATLDSSGAILSAALNHGFGWIMTYGGVSAWILAALGFLIFRRGIAGHGSAMPACAKS